MNAVPLESLREMAGVTGASRRLERRRSHSGEIASEPKPSKALSDARALLMRSSSTIGSNGSDGLRRSLVSTLDPIFTMNPYKVLSDRVVIAMVGLPARGKSYISKAIGEWCNQQPRERATACVDWTARARLAQAHARLNHAWPQCAT